MIVPPQAVVLTAHVGDSLRCCNYKNTNKQIYYKIYMNNNKKNIKVKNIYQEFNRNVNKIT